jgi:hypothetical protein
MRVPSGEGERERRAVKSESERQLRSDKVDRWVNPRVKEYSPEYA